MDINEIVRRLGGVTRAAETMGVRHPAISGWIRRGQVPAERAAQVATLIGVAPHQVRPDVFPAPHGGPLGDADPSMTTDDDAVPAQAVGYLAR